jgi:hypothetical protein
MVVNLLNHPLLSHKKEKKSGKLKRSLIPRKFAVNFTVMSNGKDTLMQTILGNQRKTSRMLLN